MNEQKKAKIYEHILAHFVECVEMFVIAICIAFMIFTFGFRLCRVDGPSMNNTLIENEILVISNIAYKPREGDIIVFHQTHPTILSLNEPIVKRVIATEGHYVKIDYDNALVYVSDDNVYDENDLIDESSYVKLKNGYWTRSGSIERYVPEGMLFVMGDNRNESYDSRDEGIGLVDERRVLGRVIVRLMPLNKFGTIK